MTGMVAPVMLVLLFGWAPVASAADYRVSFQVRAFHDCNEAASYVAAHPVIAHMSYQIRLLSSRPKVSRLGPLRQRADVIFHAAIDPRSAVLEMPQWTWPAMSAEEQAALRSYLNALQQHEVGHLIIAQHYLAGETETLHIFGPDAATLAQRLQLSTRRYASDFKSQLQRRQQLYDRVTEHGAAQREASSYGFPTGPDVDFRCP